MRRPFPACDPVSRREFLRTSLLAGGALALGAGGLQAAPLPGKRHMLVRSLRFLDLEMPMDRLGAWITPVELFFVRNHMAEPYGLDPDEWRLRVAGEVERPLVLTYADLAKLEPATVVNTLECAGNGRGFFRPQVPGVQWERGAVGNARWSGVRLRDVLTHAGLKRNARHVAFRGMDEPPGKVPAFVRSIPIEKAMHADTLLATRMNGTPLTKHHGAPLRAVVPGWVAAASVKWLAEIQVLDREFEGNFMNPGYRIPRRPVQPGQAVNHNDTDPVTALSVKSIIAQPAEGAILPLAPVRIHGAAWAGEHDVTRVEVSIDGGRTWQPAQLGRQQARYAWRLWEFAWQPKSRGEYALRSRATDSAGRTQPLAPTWNPGGYLWNVADEVKVRVEG
ncbi:MAG TPA: sulfite oxidase [Terriglobales bacterium]|nr:sulfite oxidase [Terriglobales bacterium]